jgi:hypothetical protein
MIDYNRIAELKAQRIAEQQTQQQAQAEDNFISNLTTIMGFAIFGIITILGTLTITLP